MTAVCKHWGWKLFAPNIWQVGNNNKYVHRALDQFTIKTSVFSQHILFICDPDFCGGGELEAGFWKQCAAVPLAQSDFSTSANMPSLKNSDTSLDIEIWVHGSLGRTHGCGRREYIE